jgi:hypothetical protein
MNAAYRVKMSAVSFYSEFNSPPYITSIFIGIVCVIEGAGRTPSDIAVKSSNPDMFFMSKHLYP